MGKCGVVALVVAGWVCALVSAQARRPRPAGPWQELAKKCQLDDQTIARLGRDRVVVTDQAYKQVFSPYVSSWLPVFITSDSILNGFHVLFEESLARLETAQAGRLKHVMAALGKTLTHVDQKLTGDRALIAAARKRARIVVAVAEALLGETPSDLPPDVASIVQDEVQRVTAAKGQTLPAWLGPPDSDFLAIDYGRFKPRGFYTGSETLQRYFRAMAWLQAIPFRIQHDEEMLAALMLGCAVEQLRDVGDFHRKKDATRLFEVFRKLIGLGDDWDAFKDGLFGGSDPKDRLDFEVTARTLAVLRKDLVSQARETGFSSRINDQFGLPPEDDQLSKRIGFRVVAALQTPGGLLFARTTDPRDQLLRDRRMPTGLEMGALLGSAYAMAQLDQVPRVQAIIREMASLLEGASLLADYLRCLEALLDEPEPDAPAFMRGQAWQVKQLNTALGRLGADAARAGALEQTDGVFLCDGRRPGGIRGAGARVLWPVVPSDPASSPPVRGDRGLWTGRRRHGQGLRRECGFSADVGGPRVALPASGGAGAQAAPGRTVLSGGGGVSPGLRHASQPDPVPFWTGKPLAPR